MPPIRFCVVSVSLVCFGLLTGSVTASAEPVRVVSYNVENFFYPAHDSLTNDLEWTPDGERHWSFKRYNRKAENIARVLTTIGEWDGVDLIGLSEVENAACLKKLCRLMHHDGYNYVHYDGPDERGIDVALLYRRERWDTLCTRPLHVDLQGLSTRDILYVCAAARAEYSGYRDTLHLFVCHFPSQREGAAESEWKRTAARAVLAQAVDSLLTRSPQARIIVMGDMNCRPADNIKGLNNRMKAMQESGAGTHKWHGRWTCLDQFYTSPSLNEVSEATIFAPEWMMETDEKFLGLQPKRTFVGFRYQDGYSDHLPIVLEIQK